MITSMKRDKNNAKKNIETNLRRQEIITKHNYASFNYEAYIITFIDT